jgi:hypothetical protein
MNREKFPPKDLKLSPRNGDFETWENAAQYETVYQLARIADALESIVEALPLAGKGY